MTLHYLIFKLKVFSITLIQVFHLIFSVLLRKQKMKDVLFPQRNQVLFHIKMYISVYTSGHSHLLKHLTLFSNFLSLFYATFFKSSRSHLDL